LLRITTMPIRGNTCWSDRMATPRAVSALLAQRLTGFLAFSGLVLGVVIAARDGCGGAERHRTETRNSSLSTLAPIMGTGHGTPRDTARSGACKGRFQPGRSAKLNPTP
jgi:hypothetical protein